MLYEMRSILQNTLTDLLKFFKLTTVFLKETPCIRGPFFVFLAK